MKKEIKKYQIEGAVFLKDKTSALLADEMGIGKTLQALCGINQADKVNALVLCPATVKYNWAAEIRKWGFDWSVQVIDSSKDKLGHSPITVINYEQIIKKSRRAELYARMWSHLIMDEVHYCKSYEAKRTEAVLGVYGLRTRAAKRWGLSGTPVLNRPVELYPLLKALCPERLGKYNNWMRYTKRFCEGKQKFWGYDANGSSNLEELSGILDGFMLRRLKKDVEDQLPDKIFEKILIHGSSLYKKEKIETVARTEIGLSKIPSAVAHIKDILEEKEKLVVFGYHREVMEELNRRLVKFNPVLVYGGISSKEKHNRVQKFVNDKNCRVFLGNITAAGTGIDGLQQVADTAVFVELVYTPGTMYQACDRLHRKGQKNPVLIQLIVVEGSEDERMLDMILYKERDIKKITRDPTTGLRFDIKNINTVKKGNTMSKLLDELIDQIVERVVDGVSERIQKAPKAAEVVVEEPKEKSTKSKKSAKSTTKSTKSKKEEKTEISEEDVTALRGRISKYCGNLTATKDVEQKQKLAGAIGNRLKNEVGTMVVDGLDEDQLTKYKEILLEEFSKYFGEEACQEVK